MKRLLAFAVAAILLGLWVWHALDRLAEARGAQAKALTTLHMPSVSATDTLPATDAAEAQRRLARRLGDFASAAGVRLSLSPLASGLDGLVSVRLEARGSEDRLHAFALAAEAPPSPLRFTSWGIASDGAGALRLAADISAPWRTNPAPDAVRLIEAPAAGRSPARTLFATDSPQDARPAADAPPELVGIAGRLPDDAVALVRLPDGSTHDLRIGETVNGWRLAAIAVDRVRFAKGKRQREMVLPTRE